MPRNQKKEIISVSLLCPLKEIAFLKDSVETKPTCTACKDSQELQLHPVSSYYPNASRNKSSIRLNKFYGTN